MFLDTLKFALYRSAAAETLQETLDKTKEPWPQGYEILANMANDEKNSQAKVSDLWKAQVQRTKYNKKMLLAWAATRDRTDTGRDMDALLMPCSPWPASSRYLLTPRDTLPFSHLTDWDRHGFIYDNYTSIWNVLDYCAATVPVTHVSSQQDICRSYEARNKLESKVWNNCKLFYFV